jgi:hypothetical protein
MTRYLATLLVAVFAAGCATSPDGAPARGSRSVLTEEELARSNAVNLFEAVQSLRPEWLRTRGLMTPNNPNPEPAMVYVNGVRSGTIDALRGLRLHDAVELRFLSPSDATTRYGTGHTGGAIEVRTR